MGQNQSLEIVEEVKFANGKFPETYDDFRQVLLKKEHELKLMKEAKRTWLEKLTGFPDTLPLRVFVGGCSAWGLRFLYQEYNVFKTIREVDLIKKVRYAERAGFISSKRYAEILQTRMKMVHCSGYVLVGAMPWIISVLMTHRLTLLNATGVESKGKGHDNQK